MHFKLIQNNGLTIHCYTTRDSIQFEFSTDSGYISVTFERTSNVIMHLQHVFKLGEATIDSFGITHRIRLEQYPTDYKLTLDGQTFHLCNEIVEQIRYLVYNIWRIG